MFWATRISGQEIVINADQAETPIAILEEGDLVELLFERPDKRRIVGDIFKGRVNAVLPGAIETDALRGWLTAMAPDVRETMKRNTPMRRNGLPDDIADAVLYLCSPASSFVTGELLKVDGMAADDLIPHTVPDL